mgnify:CR=1 FL=1|tara:strand:+ start:2189 stop:2782 length:594 start_codon:yes stop_codon:yes gene_type:complete
MKIAAVDNGADLYSISDVFELSLIQELHKKDLYSYKWEKENWQSDLLRRKLKYANDDILNELYTTLNSKENIQQLSDTLGKHFHGVDCMFWLDEPGYQISNHPDNTAVTDVIHIYLWPNTKDIGTTYYHNVAGQDELDERGAWATPSHDNINNLKLRKQFEYVVNTGYIMKNVYQIHGMQVPVPANSIRFSLYGHIG